jgi:hypothetical protein
MTDEPKAPRPIEDTEREFFHAAYDELKSINGKLTLFAIILILWLLVQVIGWLLH